MRSKWRAVQSSSAGASEIFSTMRACVSKRWLECDAATECEAGLSLDSLLRDGWESLESRNQRWSGSKRMHPAPGRAKCHRGKSGGFGTGGAGPVRVAAGGTGPLDRERRGKSCNLPQAHCRSRACVQAKFVPRRCVDSEHAWRPAELQRAERQGRSTDVDERSDQRVLAKGAASLTLAIRAGKARLGSRGHVPVRTHALASGDRAAQPTSETFGEIELDISAREKAGRSRRRGQPGLASRSLPRSAQADPASRAPCRCGLEVLTRSVHAHRQTRKERKA